MADRVITRLAAIPRPATFKEAAKSVQKVAAYARVSTDHEDQETSLAAQTEYYKKKIMEHPGWEFVEIYVDDGVSGLSINHREGFNRMVEDCLAGRIDLILTKSISRFARNTVDTVTTIRKLKDRGVGVYFEKENIFTTDSKGEFLLTIMSSLAQEESRSISENVTWGQRKRMADGKVSIAYGRFLGYDKGPEKYTMVVNEEQAIIVRRIFYMFLQGYTPHTISGLLTADSVPTPGGCKTWNQQTVRRMLSNEKYKGDALLQKEFTVDYLQKKIKKNEGELPQYYVKEDHEPIISPWLFDYVQERMKTRGGITYRHSGVTVLSSKVICGCCGSTYGPRPWHSTSYNNPVWQCHERVKKNGACDHRTNIYDKLLHYCIHDVARNLSVERGVIKTVRRILLAIIDASGHEELRRWFRDFKNRDAWTFLSDEDDLSMIICKMTVMQKGTLKFELLDGTSLTYRIPKYKPSRGIVNE